MKDETREFLDGERLAHRRQFRSEVCHARNHACRHGDPDGRDDEAAVEEVQDGLGARPHGLGIGGLRADLQTHRLASPFSIKAQETRNSARSRWPGLNRQGLELPNWHGCL